MAQTLWFTSIDNFVSATKWNTLIQQAWTIGDLIHLFFKYDSILWNAENWFGLYIIRPIFDKACLE